MQSHDTLRPLRSVHLCSLGLFFDGQILKQNLTILSKAFHFLINSRIYGFHSISAYKALVWDVMKCIVLNSALPSGLNQKIIVSGEIFFFIPEDLSGRYSTFVCHGI